MLAGSTDSDTTDANAPTRALVSHSPMSHLVPLLEYNQGCLCFHPSRLRCGFQSGQTTGFLLLSFLLAAPRPC